MNTLLPTMLAAAALLAQPAIAQPGGTAVPAPQQATGPAATTTPPQPMSDREFVMAAATSNMFEQTEGQLALIQAKDENVKTFARRMVDDHGAGMDELRIAATVAQIDLPGAVPLAAAQQAKVDALRALHGEAFDRAYLDDQVRAHEQAATLLETYVRAGTNPALKSWADKTLAVVRKHQQHLQALAGQVAR